MLDFGNIPEIPNAWINQMSTFQYLNELETERLAIENMVPVTDAEKVAWWNRLGEWWHRRDLGFGDGKGMKSHCFAMAKKYEEKMMAKSYALVIEFRGREVEIDYHSIWNSEPEWDFDEIDMNKSSLAITEIENKKIIEAILEHAFDRSCCGGFDRCEND